MAEPSKASSSGRVKNRVVDSVSDRAQHALKEDYDKAKAMAVDAAKSRAYLYPIKGIFYFVSHRALWKPFLSRLGPYATLSVSVIAGMFAFTYVPQLAALVFVNGPLAVFTTTLLVLNESSTIINIASRGWLLHDALLDTFDGTLVARNATTIVQQGREIRPGTDFMQKLGKILKSPFEKIGPTALLRYVMYLPLNFIPVVGTITFILLQGRNRGRTVHGRYFQLKNWSSSQRSSWLDKHTGSYSSFGVVATLLEMIPIASMFFTYTNSVGAALWAADIEAHSSAMTKETAPKLRQAAEDVE